MLCYFFFREYSGCFHFIENYLDDILIIVIAISIITL